MGAIDNFKYWIYNPEEVSSGYFWKVPDSVLNIDSKLFSLWVSVWVEEKKEKPSLDILEDAPIISFKDIWSEIFKWFTVLWSDIHKIQTWRLEETEWLLWKFFQAWEGRVEKIKETYKAIDNTWWWKADKWIITALNILWAWVDFSEDVIASWLKTVISQKVKKDFWDDVKSFVNSDFWKELIWFAQTWQEKYEAFKNSSPEANRFWLTLEAFAPLAEFIWIWEWWKILKETWEIIVETWVKLTDDVIDAGKKEIKDFFSIDNKWKTIKKEIDSIKKMWKEEIPKNFRNKQAESLIAETNSMLPTDKQKFKQMSWKDYQTWLNERWFRWTWEENVDLLAKKFIKERNALDSAFEKLPWKYNLKSLNIILDESLDYARTVENTANIKYLEWVKKWIEETWWASGKDIRKIKQIYERENKFGYINDSDAVKVARATNRDSKLREDLIKISNDFWLDLRDVSKELQQTRFILDWIGKKLWRQTEWNVFDISDRILWPVWFVEPSILLWIWVKNILTSDALKASVAKILWSDIIDIPKIKEPRLKQKIKEYEKIQKDLKKAKKKTKKRAELKKKRKEIEELIKPSTQLKLTEWQRVTQQTIEKWIILKSKEWLWKITQPKSQVTEFLELEAKTAIDEALNLEELQWIKELIQESWLSEKAIGSLLKELDIKLKILNK